MSSITDFLGMQKSQSTQISYRGALKNFLSYVYNKKDLSYNELDRYGDRYLNEVKLGKKKPFLNVIGFINSLNGYAGGTQKIRRVVVTTWLELNGIEFTRAELKQVKNKCDSPSPELEEIPLTREMIKSIALVAPPMLRTIIGVMAASGMRVGEVVSITFDDIHLNETPGRLEIQKENAKNRKKRTVFINKEAVEILKEWIKYRPTYLEKIKNKNNMDKTNDPRVFPIDRANVERMWSLAMKKAQLSNIDTKLNRNRIRLHGLRKFFRTHLARGGENGIDIAEFLMGHKSFLNYRQVTNDMAREYYRKNEHFLYIDVPVITERPETQQTIKKMEQRIQELERLNHVNTVLLGLLDIDTINKLDIQKVKAAIAELPL